MRWGSNRKRKRKASRGIGNCRYRSWERTAERGEVIGYCRSEKVLLNDSRWWLQWSGGCVSLPHTWGKRHKQFKEILCAQLELISLTTLSLTFSQLTHISAEYYNNSHKTSPCRNFQQRRPGMQPPPSLHIKSHRYLHRCEKHFHLNNGSHERPCLSQHGKCLWCSLCRSFLLCLFPPCKPASASAASSTWSELETTWPSLTRSTSAWSPSPRWALETSLRRYGPRSFWWSSWSSWHSSCFPSR